MEKPSNKLEATEVAKIAETVAGKRHMCVRTPEEKLTTHHASNTEHIQLQHALEV